MVGSGEGALAEQEVEGVELADALVRELRVVIEREQELGIEAGELLERPKFTAQRLLIAQPQVPLVHFFTVYCKLLREEADVCSVV